MEKLLWIDRLRWRCDECGAPAGLVCCGCWRIQCFKHEDCKGNCHDWKAWFRGKRYLALYWISRLVHAACPNPSR